MIVCHCEAVNDRTVEAAVLSGAQSVDAIGDRCGAGTDCGGCHRVLERLMRDHIATFDRAVAVA